MLDKERSESQESSQERHDSWPDQPLLVTTSDELGRICGHEQVLYNQRVPYSLTEPLSLIATQYNWCQDWCGTAMRGSVLLSDAQP